MLGGARGTLTTCAGLPCIAAITSGTADTG
jgi:hypothetical protein